MGMGFYGHGVLGHEGVCLSIHGLMAPLAAPPLCRVHINRQQESDQVFVALLFIFVNGPLQTVPAVFGHGESPTWRITISIQGIGW